MNNKTKVTFSYSEGSLTDIPGITVGHAQDQEKMTGCSVAIFENGAICGVDVRGGAPGTREIDLLRPENAVQQVHAIMLSGGSAYGLNASGGVMQYLEECGKGYDLDFVKVPIVPAAIIFDLNFGDPKIRPDHHMGYLAAKNASNSPTINGNTGAGTGATIGKICGFDKAMKGGLGTATVSLSNGLIVSAMIVVNAVGEIRDPLNGKVIAGACDAAGNLLDIQAEMIESSESLQTKLANTTIGIICTNAELTKAEMTKVAQMAHDGLARTIYPIHTTSDGDTLFAATVGGVKSTVNIVGLLAAEVVARAVLRGVCTAESAQGYKSFNEL
ncbi:P1 family peptidase [Providencia burhodogranariea]|uniref:Uncharacterized protein n=1 Tax=Providencia burhodogranariea DSM 19968 TaxID=1141662 RepID=K8WUI8_9GAMM|nr:P1 family peptidase [Providencia burhodogranariea]EKT63596.1 hypothetical protein OOA_04447 [Providencia burhodogranariea DSM 19968]